MYALKTLFNIIIIITKIYKFINNFIHLLYIDIIDKENKDTCYVELLIEE